MKLFLLLLLASSSTTCTVQAATQQDDDVVFRWTSTGGGWRAMFAGMGFANLFQQAGLMDDDHTHFSAISTNSGASWFSTQAFYSTEFYTKTVMAPSPADLKFFAEEWMIAYLSVAKELEEYDICDITDFLGGSNMTEEQPAAEPGPLLTVFAEFCNMLMDYDGDWTAFIDDMMASAALVYGDTTFPTRIANGDNRIAPLRGTDLLVQSALLANARIRANNMTTGMDTTVNIGNRNEQLYTLTLSAAYTVNDTFAGFQYNTLDSNDDGMLMTYAQSTYPEHAFTDFEDYHLYPPASNAEILQPQTPQEQPAQEFAAPFGGAATVVQVAAVSSAAVGPFSPAGPSTFTQALSKMRVALEDDFLTKSIFDRAANRLYASPLLDKFAVCTQWPNPCSETDGLMIDGGLVDNAAIPINIAQYHLTAQNPLDKTLKIVVTNTNEAGSWDSDRMNAQLLQYFNTSLNQGVPPGDYIWFDALPLPFRSPQIFQDSMDMDTLNALLEPIDGSDMTTAVLQVTTTDNPAFGIQAGQAVEILLINLNAPITTFIVGKTIVEQMITPVADMVHDIAANEELLARIKAFFGFPPTQDTSNQTPPPANDTTTTATVNGMPNNNGLQSTSAAATTNAVGWSVVAVTMMMVQALASSL
ncbi:expressed unknown protein [Seminavis robusta]|uniref:Uncharacterized protein n=1 Tax=Seminavis robusta TaxID=568900 RepID=A0A9N8EL33_9STRA|nr:expressed unknown protein [Seminavis robusta]|eukprot:Sro1329_g263330.1 n/a (643) ;mRNA; r:16626-18554